MPDDNVTAFPKTHNLPTGADAAGPFEERVAKLVEAANAWAKDVPTIATEEQAKKCADLIDQIREEDDAVDAARKKEKQPHDEAIAAIQNRFNPLRDRLKACTAVLRKLKDGWLRLLEQRQQEEARKALEAAAAAQAAADEAQRKLEAGAGPAVESMLEADAKAEEARLAQNRAYQTARAKPQVRGSLTGRASGFRSYWRAEITDRMAALTAYQGHPKLLETLQQLADADAREMKDALRVPGIKAIQDRRV